MGKILRFIKEEIGYFIYGIIPYADLDLFGFLYGTLHISSFGKLPFVEPIDAKQLSWFKRFILLIYIVVPVIKLDWVKFFRLHQIPGIKKVLAFGKAKKTGAAGKVAKRTSKSQRKVGKKAAHHSKKHARREAEDKGEEYLEEARGRQGQGRRRQNPGQAQQNPGQRGRPMTDGGQPVEDDSGEDSSITDSLSFSMPVFGGSDTFTMEFQSGNGGGDNDLDNQEEVEVSYNDDDGTLEAVDDDKELAVGLWWIPDQETNAYIEKVGDDFKPSPNSRRTIKEAAGVEEESATDGGSGGGGSGGGNGGGGSGRFATDGGTDGGSSPGINEDTMKAVGAVVLVAGIVGFLWISGWGQQLGDAAGLSSTGIDTDVQMRQIEGLLQKVQCFGSAACYRQWQMNNTERPGSEEVGERYQLMIENFDVNDGYTLDVNRREAESNIPVGFSVYNPRNGLKGITAHDVKYRIKILGPDSDSEDPLCMTDGENEDGWNKLGGQFSDDNRIRPGGFATPSESLNDLNLGDCGVLQPALGIERKVELQVKYDYSSQATLYVDAMSWENLQSLGERPEFKKSETADTPVQSYVNAESPIVYREDDDGNRVSDRFQVKLGFETDEDNLMYRIKPDSIKFYDSSETVHVEESRCELEPPASDNSNEYTVKDTTQEYLDRRVKEDDPSTWFDSVSGPSPIRCTLKLDEPRDISPTGETLNMRVEGNYTVMFEEEYTDFKVKNSACEDLGTYNCPLLLPKSEAEDSDYSNVLSECSSDATVDAGNGCDVRMTSGIWHTIVGPVNAKSVDGDLEEGEVALRWETFTSEWTQKGDKTTKFDVVEDAGSIDGVEDPITEPEFEGSNCPEGEEVDGCPEKSRFGLPTDEKESFQNIEDEYPYLVIEREGEGNADVKINSVDSDTVICTDSLDDRSPKEAVHDYLADHADSRSSEFQQVLWGQLKTGDCSSGFWESVYDDVNPFNEGYEDRKKECSDSFMYVEGGNGDCFVS